MAATFLVNGTFTVDHTKLEDAYPATLGGNHGLVSVTSGALGHIEFRDSLGTTGFRIDFAPEVWGSAVPSQSDALIMWPSVNVTANPRDTSVGSGGALAASVFFGPNVGVSHGALASLWDCFPSKYAPNAHTPDYSMPNGTYDFRFECVSGVLRGWFNGYSILTYGTEIIAGDPTILAQITFDVASGGWNQYADGSSPRGARVKSVNILINQFWTTFRLAHEQVF